MKLKTTFLLTFLTVFLLGFFSIDAQTRRRTRTKPKTTTVVSSTNEANATVPEIKDFAFVINIDKDSNVTLTIQKTEDSQILANSSDTKSLADFFTRFSKMQNSPSRTKPNDLLDPIFIVEADSSLKYSEVINIIQSFRISPTQKIKLEISKDFYVFVLPKPSQNNSELVPNPLALHISLDKDLKLDVNREEQGSLNDTSQLINFLKQIFRDREINGVFRVTSNEVETTVLVKAAPTVKFADVIKLMESLREAGAKPIGLTLDEFPFQNVIINRIESL